MPAPRFKHLHEEWIILFTEKGVSGMEIARRYGASKQAVYRALGKRGVAMGDLSLEQKFWRYIERGGPDDCWPWSGHINQDGYGRFRTGGAMAMAHRMVYAMTVGPIPDGLVGRHQCHNRACCNPAHLLLGTQAENVQDTVAAGRVARGERMGAAKLTDESVRTMRLEASRGVDIASLGRRFGVSNCAAWKAVRGETWKHVT